MQNKELDDVDRGKNLAEMQELVCQIEALEKSKMDGEKSRELSKAKESLLTAIQQVQSTDSNEEPGSEEPKSDSQGSIPSLAIPGNGPTGPKRAETFSGFDSKLKPDNINRASSMRVPERPGIGFPSRQLPGTVSPVVGGSPKLKHKRKVSGSGWPFMTKSNSKEDKERGGTTGTGRGGVQRGHLKLLFI